MDINQKETAQYEVVEESMLPVSGDYIMGQLNTTPSRVLVKAEKHLALGNRALAQIENKRLIELFVRHPELITALSQYYPWDGELLNSFEPLDLLHWHILSYNEALPWSIELIDRYADKWYWESLSSNKALPWSIELIDRYADKWDWEWGLSRNEALPWSLSFLESCERKNWPIDWDRVLAPSFFQSIDRITLLAIARELGSKQSQAKADNHIKLFTFSHPHPG